MLHLLSSLDAAKGRPQFTGDTWDPAWEAESTLSPSLLDPNGNTDALTQKPD